MFKPIRWLLATTGLTLIYLTLFIADLTHSWDIPFVVHGLFRAVICIGYAVSLTTLFFERVAGPWIVGQLDAKNQRRFDSLTNVIVEQAARLEQQRPPTVDFDTVEAARRLNGRLSIVEKL